MLRAATCEIGGQPVVTFHERATLALGSPVQSRLDLRTAAEYGAHHVGFTYHWTGSDGTLYRPGAVTRLRAIWREHVNVRGYGDIAYHGAFDGDGNTYGLRSAIYVGAHALSDHNYANTFTDGIVFLEDRRGLTAQAMQAMLWWQGLYRIAHHRAPALFAHEYWAKGHGGTVTQCPGELVPAIAHLGGHV